ncbi:MAG: Mut7-C RNAse domain-containing protein [Desulfosarcinaceae bacterium]|nr:Mut7-C RNAse domain-containing protein [Desulfosarcinaceae bacterium]
MSEEIYRFAVDTSLGRLAKHLRLMGFDTLYQDRADAHAFFAFSGPDRIALTRIRHLCGVSAQHAKSPRRTSLPQRRWLFITPNDPEDQVIAVFAAFQIGADDLRPFSRCTRCNCTVAVQNREAIRGRVPEYVWQTQDHFSACAECGRIYWPGSHTRRYRKKLTHWLTRSSGNKDD